MCNPKRMYSNRRAFIVMSSCGIISCGIIILLSMVGKYEIQNLHWNYLTKSPSNKTESGYVAINMFQYRLGNNMFEVAALVYVAQKTNREVVLFDDSNAHQLEKYFNLGFRRVNKTCPCFLFQESLVSYDFRIEGAIRSENATNSGTILLRGLFQSWKYIEPVDHRLRTHLKFRSDIETFARDILRKSIPTGWTEGRFIRVGIHSRRGDFLRQLPLGITTATESYFKKAMKYFVDRYSRSIQFIVVSEDTQWSHEHITYDNQSVSVNVTYSAKHSPGQDMAILSLCDHVIVSTGTYGFMSAWLANGTTVYYSYYPRNGSRFAQILNPRDYFPPHWIPMQ